MSLETIEHRLMFIQGLSQGMATNINDIKAMLEQQQKPVAPPTTYIQFGLVIDLLDHLTNERKIDAIRTIRTMTGCGLKEAKEVVDRYFDGA